MNAFNYYFVISLFISIFLKIIMVNLHALLTCSIFLFYVNLSEWIISVIDVARLSNQILIEMLDVRLDLLS